MSDIHPLRDHGLQLRRLPLKAMAITLPVASGAAWAVATFGFHQPFSAPRDLVAGAAITAALVVGRAALPRNGPALSDRSWLARAALASVVLGAATGVFRMAAGATFPMAAGLALVTTAVSAVVQVVRRRHAQNDVKSQGVVAPRGSPSMGDAGHAVA